MTTRITSAKISDTGIGRLFSAKDSVLSLSEIKAYSLDQFGDNMEDNVLDHLGEFCKALNLSDDTEVLNSYTTDHGEFFGIPYVQLNNEGKLSLVFGKVNLELIYDTKSKSYFVKGSDVAFKPLAWTDRDTKLVTAAYMSVKVEVEFDGLTHEIEYSISCKAKKEIDFKALVGKLQKGDSELEDYLQQLGVGGNYAKALKPWMLDKGFYQLTFVGENKSVTYNGSTFFAQSGLVNTIDPVTGLIGDESYLVSLKALPFKAMQMKQAENGFMYMFQIEGGYKNSDNKMSTIGYGEIVGMKRGEYSVADLNNFVQTSKKAVLTMRKDIAASSIITREQVAIEKANYLAPKGSKPENSITPTDNSLVKVDEPNFADVPF